MQTIVAMANNQGGFILCGIKDNGRINQDYQPIKEDNNLITEPLLQYVEPLPNFDIKTYKKITIIEVKQNYEYLTLCKRKKCNSTNKILFDAGDIYYRMNGSNQ